MINGLINRRKSKIKITKLIKSDTIISSKTKIADEFNDYFCTIAEKLKQDIPRTNNMNIENTYVTKWKILCT